MDLYAVVGNPVAHSKSPRIHSMFAKQTGEPIEYATIQAPLSGFANTVERFFKGGGKGLNVTVPFKEEAWLLCEVRTDRAQLAGAINTIHLRDGKVCGDNTDGAGLVLDLTVNLQQTITGKRILILGAGGAVRGAIMPLIKEQPEAIVIANRTLARAEQLAQLFGDFGQISAAPIEKLSRNFDIIINGTSASLEGSVPLVPIEVLTEHIIAYDMMYSSNVTPFCEWVRTNGTKTCVDGLGMLVEQAAESFYIWRGVRPDTQPVLQMLREHG